MSEEVSGMLLNKCTCEIDLNYYKILKYIALCSKPADWRRCKVSHLIPSRRHTKGPRPRVSGPEATSRKSDPETSQWTYPVEEAGETEMKKLLGLALEIGVRSAFNMHCYSFGGEIFLQSFGGPIGMRLTMAVSQIVMADWSSKVTEVFS